MKAHLGIFLLLVGIYSCNDSAQTVDKGTIKVLVQNDNHSPSLLIWENLKDKFPYQNILFFDFDMQGHPKNDLSKIVRLDSLTFNELVVQVKEYNEWNDHLEIYYYSQNQLDGKEVGIFLAKRIFDGTEYTFDVIQFDSEGKVMKMNTIANCWNEAECSGYTRAKLDLQSNQLVQEILQKCYDEEAPNYEAVDSVISLISLKDLDFSVLRTDAVK